MRGWGRVEGSRPAAGGEHVVSLATSVRVGARRRVVAPGGMGKTHLLEQVAAHVGTESVVFWSAAIDPEIMPVEGGVLLADDVHLADADAVRALARRVAGVVAVHRPVEGPVAEVLDALDGTPLVLERMGLDHVCALLHDRWGSQPDPDVARRILAYTAGLPRLVLAASSTGPAPCGPTPALEQAIRAERRRLGPAGCMLLMAAAVLEGMDLAVLAQAGGVDLADAVAAADQLASAGLALDAGARLVPAVADTVRGAMSLAQVQAIVDRAAGAALAGGDVMAMADRICALHVTSTQAARLLLVAAHNVLDRSPERARTWAAAADRCDVVPADRAAVRALVSFQQGHAENTVAAVDDLLRAGSDWASTPLRREAVEAASVVLAEHGAWARSAELAEAVGPAGDGSAALAVLGWLAVGDVAGARRALHAYEAERPPGLRTAAALTMGRGLVATVSDDATGALALLLEAARLYDLAAPGTAPADGPHVLAAVVACQLWEFDVAAQLLADTPSSGRPAARRRKELLAAWVAMRRGDWGAALAIVERVRRYVQVLGARETLIALAVEAGVARRRGDLDAMLRAWRRARTVLLRVPPDLLLLQPVGELLIAGARLDDRGTVGTYLASVRQLLARAGEPPLWTLSTTWDELHLAIAFDDLDAARTAAKAIDATPRLGTHAATLADAATCWVDVMTRTPEPDRVRATARALADTSLSWEASRLAGAAAIRVPDSVQMRSLLQFARGLSTPPASTLADGAAELSTREREVAVHLLAGMTYREIGAQLFIAPKTVEHHVARIRRRIGARSRAELLLALRRHVSSGSR